jgi:HPt (histidine-containing phosphotransfer) domain-containing protein
MEDSVISSLQNKERKIRDRFLENLPQRLELIEEHILNKSWAEAELLSHRLAGAHLFGYPELGNSAKKLERAIQNNSVCAEISEYFQQLKETAKKITFEK